MVNIHSHCRWYAALLLSFLSVFYGTAANYLCLSVTDGWPEISCENPESLDIQYSLDDGQTWEVMTNKTSITLDKEEGVEKVLFKGQYDESRPYGKFEAPHFVINGFVAASGSVMSLIDGEGTSTVLLWSIQGLPVPPTGAGAARHHFEEVLLRLDVRKLQLYGESAGVASHHHGTGMLPRHVQGYRHHPSAGIACQPIG